MPVSSPGPTPSTVTSLRVRSGRTVELLLTVFALVVVGLAYANVELAVREELPPDIWWHLGILAALAVGMHLVLRWRARYADPLLLPIATLLNGLGLVMIHRIDLGTSASSVATRQLLWTGVAVAAASATVILVRDHRFLRRWTYLAMAAGFLLLLMPMLPVIGHEEFGARLWIRVAGLSFQPGELAKIALTIFFAGYLVSTRDALSLVGRRFLGMQFPRARDLGPILVAWGLSVLILVLQRDLGSSLLFFGLFVAMLYVATERTSWIVIGLTLFVAGAVMAWQIFAHVQARVTLWLDPFAPGQSDQVAKGLMGLAHGGIFGTGLGEGFPYLTYFANSDYIFASFGEELGMIGVFAMLVLYA
ncbi:MAG: cell division protein, partial [Acidobacteria bacterium]